MKLNTLYIYIFEADLLCVECLYIAMLLSLYKDLIIYCVNVFFSFL